MDVNDNNASVCGGLRDGNVEEGGAVHNEQIAAVAGSGGVELPPLMNVSLCPNQLRNQRPNQQLEGMEKLP